MLQIRDFTDSRFSRYCVHCGRVLRPKETDRDHVPSKSLLDRPFPSNLPVIDVCKTCNECFSRDEEYVSAIISAIVSGSAEPEKQTCHSGQRILSRNSCLRSRIENSKNDHLDLFFPNTAEWSVEADRFHRVLLKNASGHAFYEYGEVLHQVGVSVVFAPVEFLSDRQIEKFETIQPGYFSEVGSRLLTREIQDSAFKDGWIIVQPGVYRYAVSSYSPLQVRIVVREYLAAEATWPDD